VSLDAAELRFTGSEDGVLITEVGPNSTVLLLLMMMQIVVVVVVTTTITVVHAISSRIMRDSSCGGWFGNEVRHLVGDYS